MTRALARILIHYSDREDVDDIILPDDIKVYFDLGMLKYGDEVILDDGELSASAELILGINYLYVGRMDRNTIIFHDVPDPNPYDKPLIEWKGPGAGPGMQQVAAARWGSVLRLPSATVGDRIGGTITNRLNEPVQLALELRGDRLATATLEPDAELGLSTELPPVTRISARAPRPSGATYSVSAERPAKGEKPSLGNRSWLITASGIRPVDD